MSMKRVLIFFAVGGAVLALSVFPTFGVDSPQRASFRPLIAMWVETYAPDEAEQSQQRTVYKMHGRRGDGSSAWVFGVQSPDGKRMESGRSIVDLHWGVSVQMEPFTRSKTTYKRIQPAEIPEAPETGCGSKPGTRHEKMMGYDVVPVIREVDYGGKNQVVTTKWLAPDLDCYPLRIVEMRIDSTEPLKAGPENEKRVYLPVEGEPPDSLFQVPGDYTERSPSQVHAAWLKLFPDTPLSAMNVEQQKLADDAYKARN